MRSFLVRKINNFTKTLSLRVKLPNTYGARLYVPFLDTEVKIDSQAKVSSRYYRKPQNESITLIAMWHYPTTSKEAVISNYYNTAHAVSSGPAEREHSLNMVDKLLEKNGYNKPRQMFKPRKQQSKKEVLRLATSTLPYANDKNANRIRNYIKSNKMPIRPVFTPGKTLAQTFCRQIKTIRPKGMFKK